MSKPALLGGDDDGEDDGEGGPRDEAGTNAWLELLADDETEGGIAVGVGDWLYCEVAWFLGETGGVGSSRMGFV